MNWYLAVVFGLCLVMCVFDLAVWIVDAIRGTRRDRDRAHWEPHSEMTEAGQRIEVLLMTPRGLLLRSERVELIEPGAGNDALQIAWERAVFRAATLNDPRSRKATTP